MRPLRGGLNLSTAKLAYYMGITGHPVCGKNNYPFSGSGLDMVHSSVIG